MVNKEKSSKTLLSSTELAKILGVSRVAVYKKIMKGEIPAEKVGRNFVISTDVIGDIIGTHVSEQKKEQIARAVRKTVNEYGEALRLLGKE